MSPSLPNPRFFALLLIAIAMTLAWSGKALAQGADDPCGGDVTVIVVNQTNKDIRLRFGNRTIRRAFPGLKIDSVKIDRYRSRLPLYVQVARGGLGRGPTYVQTTGVRCNRATLFITEPLSSSFWAGADIAPRR